VRQLRVLSAALPGTAIVERVLDAPFGEVWAHIQDLERTVPTFDPLVAAVRIEARDGEHLRIRARTTGTPVWTPFDVVLRPGFCWMQSRLYVVGMAAVADGDRRTRYAHVEGVPFRRAPRRLLEPVMRRVITTDVDGIERLTVDGM
jgi:hypothetical protein